MKINVKFKAEADLTQVQMSCILKGEYPTTRIFSSDATGSNAEEYIKIYPTKSGCVSSAVEKYFEDSLGAATWVEEMGQEIHKQYALWKENALPEDFTISVD